MPGAIDDHQQVATGEKRSPKWQEFLSNVKETLRTDLQAVLKLFEQEDLELDDIEVLDALIVAEADIRRTLYCGFNLILNNLPDDEEQRKMVVKECIERLKSQMI